MAKICPLIMMALLSLDKPDTEITRFESPQNQNRHTSYTAKGDCFEKYCQIWNSETGDCGLKRTSVTSDLTGIKSAIVKITDGLEAIKNRI